MQMQQHGHDVLSIVRVERTSDQVCRLSMVLERNGGTVWKMERDVVLVDCDHAAVERTAIEAVAALVEHLVRWPRCTRHCLSAPDGCRECQTFLTRPRVAN